MNKDECCRPATPGADCRECLDWDHQLAPAAQSSYVRIADGYYSRLCRVQPPGAAPEPAFFGRFQRSSSLPEPARTARPQGGTVPEHRRRPIPGTYATRDGFERRYGHNRTRRGPTDFRRALRRRKDGHQRPTGGPPPPDMFQTGRRLMRQTVLPSQFCGPSAPMRSDSSARRRPRQLRGARRLGLCFGLPLTPESGGPSRHPSAPSAPTAIRVRRLQEFQNAEQNVDRCHPPGGDPGCRGPWQSRRRV